MGGPEKARKHTLKGGRISHARAERSAPALAAVRAAVAAVLAAVAFAAAAAAVPPQPPPDLKPKKASATQPGLQRNKSENPRFSFFFRVSEYKKKLKLNKNAKSEWGAGWTPFEQWVYA